MHGQCLRSVRPVGVRGRLGRCGLVALAAGLVLGVGGGVTPSALAAGTPFQRGDVFASGPDGIGRYGPDGTPKGTITSAPASSLCFAPDGGHLIAPGVGLFDSSGNLLASHWASIASPIGECAVDGLGDVYVGGGPSGGTFTAAWGTIRKFDLDGDLLRSYTVDASGGANPTVSYLDIAADQCTIYYNTEGANGQIKRFNVCTNTQATPFSNAAGLPTDQLRIRTNGQVISVHDSGWTVLDTSGAFVSSVGGTPLFLTASVRNLSLDPDGTSVWIGGGGQTGSPFDVVQNVARFDIASGALLARWAAPPGNTSFNSSPGLAAYGPPLLGNANIPSGVDSNPAGTAEAFATRVSYSGQLSSLELYVDGSSTATPVVLGIYSDRGGHPGALKDQATITNVAAGARNSVQVPSLAVTAGQRLWIAVLGPRGAGTIRFRDGAGGLGSETSAQHSLRALPANWSTGTVYADGHLSADGS
jgi:hypothetical protein